MKTRILLSAFVLISLTNQALAQENPVTLANTKAYELASEEVGDTYQIHVSLPFGYGQTQTTYGTLYVLDDNASFAMVRDIQMQLSFEPENPPLIVVGIGYADFRAWISKRFRDYMAAEVAQFPGSGGASKFLAFMEKELIPDVEAKFRTNATRFIYGHSTAGLFGLYALRNSDSFEGVIATSPSIETDGEYTIQEMQKDINPEVKLYTSVGSKEADEYKAMYEEFVSKLSSKMKDTTFKSEVFDASHMASMAPSFIKGLQFMTKKE